MRKTHASSLIHIVSFIKRLFSTLLHVCSYGVETKSSRLSVKLSIANPVSTWIGERLTLPAAVDFSCLFFPQIFFCRHFVTHSNNSVFMCSKDAFS